MEHLINSPVLRMDEWLESDWLDPEISATFGRLYFGCGDTDFMAHRRGATFRDAAYLPAYPLAMWIVQSWWRLLYEPKPASDTFEWSATHCMRYAGHGFLWPDIWMQSDGVFMNIVARPYIADTAEPIEYFPRESRGIALDFLEACLSDFVDSVLVRLSRKGTDLEKLWREVTLERQSNVLSFQRKIEAILGYDPDELPEEELQDLANNRHSMGKTNLLEALAAFRLSGYARNRRVINKIHSLSDMHGVWGRFDLPALGRKSLSENLPLPWELGRKLARDLRSQICLKNKVETAKLKEMLGLSEKDFNSSQAEADIPFSVGTGNAEVYRFTFLKDCLESKRFQAARFIGDHCISRFREKDTNWLILSDSTTYRQKAQRAFGAEFLMPVDLIKEYTDGQYTQRNIKKVAARFEVSPVLVATQLANHKLIPHDDVEMYSYVS